MRTSRDLFLLLCLGLTGCQFTPSATTKTVTTNDVVGVWSFTEDETAVLITFMPSGIFTQQLVIASQTNLQVGKWSLNGPHLHLEDFLSTFGSLPTAMHWYFIDGDQRALEIFGGAFPDPDAFQHLRYLRAAP